MPNLDPDEAALRAADQAAVVAAPAALTSAAITGGESPTEAEYNALQADVAALRTKLASVITELKNAGLMASS